MRIFLVGNGPSLAKTNLDLIADEASFGMNRVHLIYPKTRWRPTYFMWADLAQSERDRAALAKHILDGEEVYVRHDIADQLMGKWKAYPRVWVEELPPTTHPWTYHSDHLHASPGDEHWPKEWCFPQEKGVLCKIGNGIIPMMQQSIKLGYDDIVLLGCDLDWHVLRDEKDSNHFCREYEVNLEMHTQDRADYNNRYGIAMHELAKPWCDAHNVRVRNATVGGSLEVYPRATLEEVCAVS